MPATIKSKKQPLKATSNVGSTKKPRNKTKTLMLSACAALLLLSTGYGGVTVWQNRQLKAKAAGWTTIGGGDTSVLYMCKTYTNSAYGAIWRITSVFKAGSTNNYIYVSVMRGGSIVNQTYHSASANSWGRSQYNYASIPLGDTFKVTSRNGGTVTGALSTITSC